MIVIDVDFFRYRVGSGGLVDSFFDTISKILEKDQWGIRFPIMMNKFYSGQLEYNDVEMASIEIETIRKELKNFKIEDAVLHLNDEEKKYLNKKACDLSEYFIAIGGKKIIDVIASALRDGIEIKHGLCLKVLEYESK